MDFGALIQDDQVADLTPLLDAPSWDDPNVKVRDTLLPLLLLPVLTPVLLAATRAFEDALGTVGVNGWAWVNLLVVFAAVYVGLALALASTLLEES